MGLESKFWNKLGFILILAHFPATWELKIWKFSNFGQNHFSDFETPFLASLTTQKVIEMNSFARYELRMQTLDVKEKKIAISLLLARKVDLQY